jgi:hypothetical protein
MAEIFENLMSPHPALLCSYHLEIKFPVFLKKAPTMKKAETPM